jgi:hypothetical protein
MKSKESPAINLPTEPILAMKHAKHKLSYVPESLLPSVCPAVHKGWACKLYVICMHSKN